MTNISVFPGTVIGFPGTYGISAGINGPRTLLWGLRPRDDFAETRKVYGSPFDNPVTFKRTYVWLPTESVTRVLEAFAMGMLCLEIA